MCFDTESVRGDLSKSGYAWPQFSEIYHIAPGDKGQDWWSYIRAKHFLRDKYWDHPGRASLTESVMDYLKCCLDIYDYPILSFSRTARIGLYRSNGQRSLTYAREQAVTSLSLYRILARGDKCKEVMVSLGFPSLDSWTFPSVLCGTKEGFNRHKAHIDMKVYPFFPKHSFEKSSMDLLGILSSLWCVVGGFHSCLDWHNSIWSMV